MNRDFHSAGPSLRTPPSLVSSPSILACQLKHIWVFGLFVVAASAQPTVKALVNAASYDPSVTRGAAVAMFGEGLARSQAAASSVPLPTVLDGTRVLVGDVELEAPIYSVSPMQVNFLLPFEALGDRIPVVVVTGEGRSKPYWVRPAPAGPGIFTSGAGGKGRALVLGPDYRPVDTVTAGGTITLYAAGLGPTDPPVLTGTPGAVAEPFNRVTVTPEVFVGDAPADVVFAGLAPGLAGVYQVNVVPRIPATDRVWMRSRGFASNVAEIGVASGNNVANATGAIELVYPTSGESAFPIGYSPHPFVGRFSARFDITPGAGPFSLAAVAEGDAIALIRFDPAAGTYEANLTVPSQPVRYGDFSRTGRIVTDLFTCHIAPDGSPTCHPFPGNIIPSSRIDAQHMGAIQSLPLPDVESSAATGTVTIRGEARRGSTFAIDSTTNASLSMFSGFIDVPIPPPGTRTVTLKLFIDGRRVASAEVPYRVGPFQP